MRSGASNILGATESEVGRFALIGGPGQGKTTIGQYICQLFRTAILREKPEWSLDPEVRKALGVIEVQCKEDEFELPSARRFPIRIILSKFARSLASKEEGNINSLLSYIVDRIRRKTDREVSLDDFRQWLKIYPWILILDGLDEVPASSNRDEVLAALRSFRMESRSSNADILIIATTRPQGYSQEFSPGHFQHKYLAPLSPARAMNYGRRLVNVRHSGDQERKEKILTRLERASQQAATARLMRSPLQVTIMATLVDRMGQPPQERWNLFREYYNVIYQREVERDIPAAAILREYKMDVDMIHKYVGLLLQVESERTGRTDARLSSEDFADVVEARLNDVGHQGEERISLKRDIIRAATDRLVFLVGLEADEVGFEIRSLQEYMAAEGLMAGSDIDVRNRLREIAPSANWRNVFLFTAGKCAAEREDLLDTIYAICLNLNDDPDDEVARRSLAGSQLALDLLEDTPIKQQPKNARSLARIAIRLLDSPPGEHQVRLGDLYSPVLELIYRDEITNRLKHIDFYRCLGALACLIRLVEANVAWANALKDEQWPIDLTEQHALLKINRLARGSMWLQSKFVDIIPRLHPNDVYELVNNEAPLSIRGEDDSTPTWGGALGVILDEDPFPNGTINISIFSPKSQSSALQPFILSATEDSKWLIPMQDMPGPSPSWVVFVAAARFLTSPSKDTLARELRLIANEYDIEEIDWSISMLPWPISACLAEASNQADLLNLADRVIAGEFGDAEDWFDAEERWVRVGITQDDMEYATDDKWPFDKKVSSHGFPFAAGSWSYTEVGAEKLLRQLLEMHSKLEKSRMRTEVTRWILSILGMVGRPHNTLRLSVIPSVQVIERFRKFVEDILPSKYSFNLDSFNSIRYEDKLTDEWIDFFNKLGKQPKIHKAMYYVKISKDSNEEVLFRRLSEAYSRDPGHVGILRLISFFVMKESGLPESLNPIDPKQYNDDLIREAAIIVRLVQGNWDDLEAKELAKCIKDLLDRRPSFKSTLERLIERLPASLDLANILLELNQQLSSSQWELSQRIIESLNDSLRRRTSQLGAPEVWNGLNLPAGLSSLLRE